MFNFSRNKNQLKIRDVVWVTSEAKWKGVEYLHSKNPNTVFVFWFDQSLDEAKARLNNDKIEMALARELHAQNITDKTVVFVEHYPLPGKEQELFQQLELKEVKILSALDEPLFKRFGADKIVGMIRSMGMDENKPIENQMISNAIRNAQEKLEKQVTVEHPARSQQGWLDGNVAASD